MGKGKDGRKKVVIIGESVYQPSLELVARSCVPSHSLLAADYILYPPHLLLPSLPPGCGVGGAATAARLGKAGLDVVVVEKVGGRKDEGRERGYR